MSGAPCLTPSSSPRNWKMNTTPGEAGPWRAPSPRPPRSPASSASSARRSSPSPSSAMPWPAPMSPSVPRTSTPEPVGAYTGEIAAPMLAGLATWASSATPSAAATRARRRAHRPQAAALRRVRPAADPVRRRAARGARGRPRRGDRPGQLRGRARGRASQGARRPGRPRHRLRAGVGHRHRSDGARRRRGGDGRRRSGRRVAELGAPSAAPARPGPLRRQRDERSIGEFLAEPAIDGALVGGASLKVDEMAGIVARAGLTAAGADGSRRAPAALTRRAAS